MNKLLLEQVKKIITKAGQMAVDFRQKKLDIILKADGSPVSNADQQISNFIAENLRELAPTWPVICEEQEKVELGSADNFWLVDPIDGTESYIKNEDNYTINIALIQKQVPRYGFIYHPLEKLLYYTDLARNLAFEQAGGPVIIKPHTEKKLIAAVSLNSPIAKTAQFLDKKKIGKIISLSSSLKLAMVAAGLVDIYPQADCTMEWDIAAGCALVKASGGDIRPISGEKLIYGKDKLEHLPFIAMSKRYLTTKN